MLTPITQSHLCLTSTSLLSVFSVGHVYHFSLKGLHNLSDLLYTDMLVEISFGDFMLIAQSLLCHTTSM